MTEHLVPLRWSDLDSLRHVNNVKYAVIAEEVQARLVAEGRLPAERTVTSVEVTYRAPMHLSTRPVVVTSAVDGDVLVQDLAMDDADGTRHEHARVETRFGEREHDEPSAPDVALRTSYRLREVDGGRDGTLGVAALLELAQENRIAFIHRSGIDTVGSVVVVSMALELHDDLPATAGEVTTATWIGHVGTSSYTVLSELVHDGRVVLRCRAVLVGFDLEAERSRPLDDEVRTRLLALTAG